MKIIHAAVFATLLLSIQPAQASVLPSPGLEEKIAYQQGRFGALYAHCGSPDEQAVIGGSLAGWKTETFRGFRGRPDERAHLEKAFDQAAENVGHGPDDCRDWIRHAAATWHAIIHLAEDGEPAAIGR